MRAATRTQLILGCFFFTVSQFGMLYVFPILPDITQDFFPQLSESQLGFRQGYLAGIYFLGNFFGALFWGKVADRIGRKGGFIVSTSLYTTCIVIFGLSMSFSMALVMRFLWGLSNGIDPIAKTFAAEISENNRDIAQSLSALGLTDGIGRLIGPTISAWLSRPADKVSWLDNQFLRRFPYFLPSMVCVGLGLMAILISAVLMKETVRKGDTFKSKAVVKQKYKLLEVRGSGASSDSDEDLGIDIDKNIPLTPKAPAEDMEQSWNSIFKLKQTLKNTFKPFSKRSILTPILVYNMYCFIVIQQDELVTLMLVTPPAYGGFCLTESGLGFITFCVSLLQIPWALFIGPYIICRLGVRRSLRLLIVLSAILLFLMPLWTRNPIVQGSFTDIIASSPIIYSNRSAALSSNGTHFSFVVNQAKNLSVSNSSGFSLTSCSEVRLGITDVPVKVWTIFFILYIPTALHRISIFACANIAVVNSAKREERATVSGISQSGAAMARVIGPIFSANIYAWSISTGNRWPLDATFIWTLGCIQLMILFAISFLYSPQVEHPID